MNDHVPLSRESVLEAIRTHEYAVEAKLFESTDLTLMLAQDCLRYMDALEQIAELGFEYFLPRDIARAALAGKEGDDDAT